MKKTNFCLFLVLATFVNLTLLASDPSTFITWEDIQLQAEFLQMRNDTIS